MKARSRKLKTSNQDGVVDHQDRLEQLLAKHTMGHAFCHWAGVPQPKNHAWSLANNFDRDFGLNEEGKWAILGPPRVYREWNDRELIESAVNEMAGQPLHTSRFKNAITIGIKGDIVDPKSLMKVFDPSKKIPTVVWLSPNGKLYMVNGHHREAACQRRNLSLRRQIEDAIEALALAEEKDGVNSFSNIDLRNTLEGLLKEFQKRGRWLSTFVNLGTFPLSLHDFRE
jgi:hypothetical protein